MGIRFACHACAKPLNIKAELAGKRGVCPQCGTRFRIPQTDTAQSIPLDSTESLSPQEPAASSPQSPASEPLDDPAIPQSRESAIVTQEPALDPTIDPTIDPTMSRVAESVPTVALAAAPAQRAQAASLLDDPVAVWYVRPPSGGQYGPASGDMLRSWIVEARVTGNSLIWRDGWAQWRTASDVLTEFAAQEPLVSKTVNPVGANHDNGSARIHSAVQVNGDARGHGTADPHSSAAAVAPLTGDSTIGKIKSKRSGNRFVMIGTLAALSMTLIGVLIYLIQR